MTLWQFWFLYWYHWVVIKYQVQSVISDSAWDSFHTVIVASFVAGMSFFPYVYSQPPPSRIHVAPYQIPQTSHLSVSIKLISSDVAVLDSATSPFYKLHRFGRKGYGRMPYMLIFLCIDMSLKWMSKSYCVSSVLTSAVYFCFFFFGAKLMWFFLY